MFLLKEKKWSYNSFFFFFPTSWSYDGLALGLSMVWVISEQSGLKFRFGFWFRCLRFSWFLRFRLLLHTGKFSVFFDDSSVFRCILLLSRSSWFICVVFWFFFFSKSFASPNNYLNASDSLLRIYFFNLLYIQICIWIYVYIFKAKW